MEALIFHEGRSSLSKDSVNPSKAFAGQYRRRWCVAIDRRLTKLPGGVESKAGYCVVSTSRANIKDISALVGRAILSEELDGLGTALIIVNR